MTKGIEREAFKLEMMDDYNMREVDTPFGKDFAMGSTKQAFKVWQAAKAHEAEKLKGKVVVPFEPTQKMIDAFPEVEYEDNYCGTCSTWLDDITIAKAYKAMLEAARSGNE